MSDEEVEELFSDEHWFSGTEEKSGAEG